MYENTTDRSRKVMQLANQEAQRWNHEYIGTEHILLGLVKEGEGVAAQVLKNLLDDGTAMEPLYKVLHAVRLHVKEGSEKVLMGRLPHTPRIKKVIECSTEEARNLNHDHVGTEHLLLGLLREQDGVACKVLTNLGLELEGVRQEVLDLLKPHQPVSPTAAKLEELMSNLTIAFHQNKAAIDRWHKNMMEQCQRWFEDHKQQLEELNKQLKDAMPEQPAAQESNISTDTPAGWAKKVLSVDLTEVQKKLIDDVLDDQDSGSWRDKPPML